MNEQEFADSFDGCFPYEDEEKWRVLILEGKAISDNASFCVLHDICRKPFGSAVTPDEQLRMLGEWSKVNRQDFAPIVIKAAKAIIADELLSVAEVLAQMESIRKYRGQYAALAIVYFACNDTEGALEGPYFQIINEWKENAV